MDCLGFSRSISRNRAGAAAVLLLLAPWMLSRGFAAEEELTSEPAPVLAPLPRETREEFPAPAVDVSDFSAGVRRNTDFPAPLRLLAAAPPAAPTPQDALSDAERIARLQRAIEADQKALQDVQTALNNPESDYHKLETEFRALDEQVNRVRKQLQQLQDDQKTADADQLQVELTKLESQWQLAKERFDLAIEERKTTQEKSVTLKQQLLQDQEALAKLNGPAQGSPPATEPKPEAGGAPPAEPANASSGPTAPAETRTAAAPMNEAAVLPPAPAPAPAVEAPTAASVLAATPPSSSAAVAPAAPGPERRVSKELQQATAVAQQKEAAAQSAEQEAHSIAERMDLLRKDIGLERKLIETARKKADIAEQTRSGLDDEYRAKLVTDPGSSAVADLRRRIQSEQQRFRDARAESRDHSSRLDELQSRFAALQADQIAAMGDADRKRVEAETARLKVEELRNPFTTRNILQWLIDHGPRIILILLAMAIVMWMSRVAERRLIEAMVSRGGHGRRLERENRARTLVSVFQNAANVAIVSGGVLMLLDSIGAPITALMGGAAVFGLAVAFGAQSLIKDYFYGFMILLEQQYTINDVIRIGEISGLVERITLRMTVLRDLEGCVHFIPHGQITSTTNMTHGWSRALFDIGVAYKEDTDQVVQIIKDLGRELRRDPKYAPFILEDLTMLGVDALRDSAIMLKFFIKTEPLKQWDVKREMLRRIKKEFDARGIEIPFPQRMLHHRHEGPISLDDVPELNLARRQSA